MLLEETSCFLRNRHVHIHISDERAGLVDGTCHMCICSGSLILSSIGESRHRTQNNVICFQIAIFIYCIQWEKATHSNVWRRNNFMAVSEVVTPSTTEKTVTQKRRWPAESGERERAKGSKIFVVVGIGGHVGCSPWKT